MKLPLPEYVNLDGAVYTDLSGMLDRYIELSAVAELEQSPAAEVALSNLHAEIMREMWLSHDNPGNRKAFASVLRAYRGSRKQGSRVVFIDAVAERKTYIYVGTEHAGVFGTDLDWELNNLSDTAGYCAKSLIFGYWEEDAFEGIARVGRSEYREGSYNGSSGYWVDPDSAEIEPEMETKIRAMGLIPVVVSVGSYHENWLHVAGVFPDMFGEYLKQQND